MKKLFPLMFAIVFAGQVFAEEGVTANAEVVNVETTEKAVATKGELAVEVVINEEEKEKIEAEAVAVIAELKKEGLTDGQIVAVVEEALKDETTEHQGRSILKKNNKDRVVWLIVGLALGLFIAYVGHPLAVSAYNKFKTRVDQKTGDAGVTDTGTGDGKKATPASAAADAGGDGGGDKPEAEKK